jgi:hypothetical protein
MRRLVAFGLGSAALLSGALVRAEEPWATGKMVPTVRLSGSTSGKGEISAGVDFSASQSDTWDVFLNPAFTVANSGGVASILTASLAEGAAGPTQFSVSFSATFASRSAEPRDAGKSSQDGSSALKNRTRELRRLLYPQHLFAFGATYGAGVFKYLEGAGATLKERSSTLSSVAGNVLFTYVQPRASARFTLELPLGLKSTWTESDTTAYTCSPVGTLKGKSVETCEKTPMGAPTRGLQISGAALLGIAAVAEGDLWRAAIGPVFMIDVASKAKTRFQIGSEIPLYLSLAKAAGYEGDYEGMVRIMPTVLAEQTKDEKGASSFGISAILSVALLGKRKMFGSQLYWP